MKPEIIALVDAAEHCHQMRGRNLTAAGWIYRLTDAVPVPHQPEEVGSRGFQAKMALAIAVAAAALEASFAEDDTGRLAAVRDRVSEQIAERYNAAPPGAYLRWQRADGQYDASDRGRP